MNALIIMLAVRVCAPTHQVHIHVLVVMALNWMKTSTVVKVHKFSVYKLSFLLVNVVEKLYL